MYACFVQCWNTLFEYIYFHFNLPSVSALHEMGESHQENLFGHSVAKISGELGNRNWVSGIESQIVEYVSTKYISIYSYDWNCQIFIHSNWNIEVYLQDVQMYRLNQIKSNNLKTGKPFPWDLRAERTLMFGILLQLDIWLEARRHARK